MYLPSCSSCSSVMPEANREDLASSSIASALCNSPSTSSLFKCRARRLDGLVHVGGIGFRNLTNLLTSRGIDCRKGLSRLALDPAIVNRKPRRRRSYLGFVGNGEYSGHWSNSF